jgi:hypothetical protein
LACLVFATLFATSLILPHAITHTAWFTLQRRSSAARFTCLLVSRRVASFVTNAFLHTLHQCLALGVLNGPQRQQKDKTKPVIVMVRKVLPYYLVTGQAVPQPGS